MTEAIEGDQNSSPANGQSYQDISAKRRKVRKGTRSCWECKRRKIRCIFSSFEDAACIGCQRRRVPCVAQEMPEDLSPAIIGNRHLSERISKVEDLLKEIIESKDAATTNEDKGVQQQDRQPGTKAQRLGSRNLASPPTRVVPLIPVEAPRDSASNSSLLVPGPACVSNQTETDSTIHHLLAVFPAKKDVLILLKESHRPSLYTFVTNTQSHSRRTSDLLSTPYSAKELPGPNTHPVILAKLMLLFSITLQSPDGEQVLGLSEPHAVLMRRLTTAATTWVTNKEAMHETLEGLICIILEGVFEVAGGNLRRAWVVYRRAMTVAQLMGLHRSPLPPLKRIDPNLDADPDFIWFRIVYMDRYLSLLLGLPQGTIDKNMAAMSVLQHEPPLGKFERLLTVTASRILERNEDAFTAGDLTTTLAIDSELLQISRSMPATFWRPATFSNLTIGSPDTFLETLRLAAQVYYYGLLIQLHLPYMLRMGEKTAHEYSKMTCVNASREIMTRFIAHRIFNPMSSCSRPVDFLALLASMTLLLAHLDAHHHRDTVNVLAHQRLSDRAMLDQALERMEAFSSVKKDVIMEKSAELIRRLLQIEGDAVGGSAGMSEPYGGPQRKKEDEPLRLHIPYLGVIKIARNDPISRELPLGSMHAGREKLSIASDRLSASPICPTLGVQVDEQLLNHSQDTTQGSAFSTGFPAPEWPKMHLQTSGYDQSMFENDILQPHVELPPLAATVNDWAFQGVDTAFFDSLLKGNLGEEQ
ncbi:C6 zinc finger domain protein [Clohesyomyces aquaticus]|uniref:C6 zinc finger domain protein n=1 Tax=Clohesyomyces aquaticus TaxID=1231657 RepID=A0A1Y1Z216_9PLEO|nr:C6 zinc finger domain protein [Clohesyomyces aquaticus]